MALPSVVENSHSLSGFSPLKAVLFLDPAGSASSFPAHSVLFIFLAYCTAGASVPCSSAPGTGPRFSASSGQGPGQLTATLPSAVVWSLLGLWQRDSCSPPPPPSTPARGCDVQGARDIVRAPTCLSRPGLDSRASNPPTHVAPSPLPGPQGLCLSSQRPRGRPLVAHAPHGTGAAGAGSGFLLITPAAGADSQGAGTCSL